MCDVLVVETSQHMYDGVCLPYVSEEFVSEAFSLACSFHKSCDIHYLACGGYDTSRVYYFGEACQSFVGHGDDADVGFYGAEGEVSRLCLCA